MSDYVKAGADRFGEPVMTDTQTLTRAIELAIENGWENSEAVTAWKDGYGVQKLKSTEHLKEFNVEHIIYNHNFAKALWGGELHQETFIVPKELNERFAGTKDLDIKPAWQYHLQQMVVADDPIEYLRAHMEDK